MAWNGSDQTASGAHRSRGRISAKCATPGEATSPSLRGQDVGRKTSDVGGDKRQKTHHCRPTFSTYFLLLLLLLALAGAAVWYFLLRPAPLPPAAPKSHNSKSQIKQSTPALSTNAVAGAATRPRYTRKGVEFGEQPPAPEALPKPPPVESVMIGSTNRTFKSGLEQTLCNIFTVELGDMPPPLPIIPDSELDNVPVILATMCQEKEGDSDLIRFRKQIVNEAKKEMIRYLKEGGDFDEFLSHYHGELKKAFFEQKRRQQQVDEVCAEQEPALAVAYYRKVNEELAAKGIKPVELPDDFAEANGLSNDNAEKEENAK